MDERNDSTGLVAPSPVAKHAEARPLEHGRKTLEPEGPIATDPTSTQDGTGARQSLARRLPAPAPPFLCDSSLALLRWFTADISKHAARPASPLATHEAALIGPWAYLGQLQALRSNRVRVMLLDPAGVAPDVCAGKTRCQGKVGLGGKCGFVGVMSKSARRQRRLETGGRFLWCAVRVCCSLCCLIAAAIDAGVPDSGLFLQRPPQPSIRILCSFPSAHVDAGAIPGHR
ncbi:hypothetical protein M422DRAFT_241152 [Sphaerobolus stellatus SS14]|nr:hypothetical protein M422DRAFT_775202 [Sphaerobolus stellatus SS14]KIJ55071.1 hypothetical protein M422DRAFT_241152 [Sphaerobolus stellatus SS14]